MEKGRIYPNVVLIICLQNLCTMHTKPRRAKQKKVLCMWGSKMESPLYSRGVEELRRQYNIQRLLRQRGHRDLDVWQMPEKERKNAPKKTKARRRKNCKAIT